MRDRMGKKLADHRRTADAFLAALG
jgi:hypothetical protein